MEKTVSIIITCYNKAPYIADSIESALSQTYANVEVIVIDDGSKDGSAAIIEQFLSRGVKFIQQENKGVCIARNNAIRQSTGEFIVPLDADDILAPNYVQKCIEWFCTDPSTKLVYTLGEFFGLRTGPIEIPPYNWDSLLWYSIIPATSMYRRTDFDRTKGYNPNMQFALEDWDFYLSLLNPTDIVHLIEEPLLRYRIVKNARNTCINPNKEAIFKQIYDNHRDLYSQHNNMLLLANDNWKEYEHLYQEIRESKAYRLGKALLRPYTQLRSCLSHLH